MSTVKPFENHQRDTRSFMDLNHAEEDAMDPARAITDELVAAEGFSEEQAYEIALESGQDWAPPPEDVLSEDIADLNSDNESEADDEADENRA